MGIDATYTITKQRLHKQGYKSVHLENNLCENRTGVRLQVNGPFRPDHSKLLDQRPAAVLQAGVRHIGLKKA